VIFHCIDVQCYWLDTLSV